MGGHGLYPTIWFKSFVHCRLSMKSRRKKRDPQSKYQLKAGFELRRREKDSCMIARQRCQSIRLCGIRANSAQSSTLRSTKQDLPFCIKKTKQIKRYHRTFVIHVWQTSIAFSLHYQLCFVFCLWNLPLPLLFPWSFFFPLSLTDLSFFIRSRSHHWRWTLFSSFFYAQMVSIGGNFCSFSNISVSPWNNDCVTCGVPKNNFFEISPPPWQCFLQF